MWVGVALRPEREGDSPIVCVRLLLCQRGLPHRDGIPGGWGMFASGAYLGVGCAAGTDQVCVVCAGRRVRGVCGSACAGMGVCFQPDLDFRFFRMWGYCNFRNTFPDFIRA